MNKVTVQSVPVLRFPIPSRSKRHNVNPKEEVSKRSREAEKEKQEATVRLNEEIKSTHSLFQLGFTRATEKDQATASDFSREGSDVTTVLPSEPAAVQAVEPRETAKNKQDVQCHVMDAERQIPEPEPEFQNDVGLWRNITNAVQEHWCSRDALECQHFDNDFSASLRQYDDGTTRHFTHFMTFRNQVNGEKIKREWLMYSPSSGNVYCMFSMRTVSS